MTILHWLISAHDAFCYDETLFGRIFLNVVLVLLIAAWVPVVYGLVTGRNPGGSVAAWVDEDEWGA